MREILFRGKRMDNGEWAEGSFLQDGEAHRLARQEELPFSDCYIVPKTERDNVRRYLTQGICLDIHAHHVDPDTVGQYTGLTDKNGKRIFEGDILLLDDIKGFVNYGTGCFCVRMLKPDYLYRSNPVIDIVLNAYPGLEVIGNIHDDRMEDFCGG